MESLQKIGEGHYALCRNEQPLQCPYAARLLVPGSVAGTAGISGVGCNTMCPLFRLEVPTLPGKFTAVLCNGTSYPDLSISDPKAANKPSFLTSL